MPKIKIHKTTRVVFGVTQDNNPDMPPWMTAVDTVPGKDISGSAKKTDDRTSWKLQPDNDTLVEATQQELDNTDDDIFPRRAPLRALRSATQAALNAPSIKVSDEIKEYIRKLREYLGYAP